MPEFCKTFESFLVLLDTQLSQLPVNNASARLPLYRQMSLAPECPILGHITLAPVKQMEHCLNFFLKGSRLQ